MKSIRQETTSGESSRLVELVPKDQEEPLDPPLRRLKRAMRDARMSQADLSRALGYSSPTAVGGWFAWVEKKGRERGIPQKQHEPAARALGVDVNWLATGEGEADLPSLHALAERFEEMVALQRSAVASLEQIVDALGVRRGRGPSDAESP